MAVSAKMFGNFPKHLAAGLVNWTSDTIKIMLTTSSYVPDQDLHDFKDDVTNEVSGTGYTAGGATLTSKTSTYSGGSNTLTLDAADVTWGSSTITARRAVIYKDTGTASTSPLIGYVDFGEDLSSTSGPFTITWDAGGILTVTVS